MAKAQEILADNLKESLQAVQRYMLAGTGTALFTLLLVVQGAPGPGDSSQVTVPLVELETERQLAGVIAIAIYWLSGYMATLTVDRIRRIIDELGSRSEIVRAALTYPSLPTICVPLPRIGAAILPAILVLVGVIAEENSFDAAVLDGETIFYSILGLVLLISPSLVLTGQLWRPLGDFCQEERGD